MHVCEDTCISEIFIQIILVLMDISVFHNVGNTLQSQLVIVMVVKGLKSYERHTSNRNNCPTPDHDCIYAYRVY